MSDVIPKPGLYRQQNGKPADVKWVGDGKALGFDSNGEETCWEAASGKWYAMTASATCPVHITGPWIPDPPEPPAGFVVMPKEYVPTADDKYHDSRCEWRMIIKEGTWVGLASAEWLDKNWPSHAPHYIASPIPKPFSISEHGPGVYARRDGVEANVDAWHEISKTWSGRVAGDIHAWFDDGKVNYTGEHPADLVRYLRPLPKPAVDPGEGWRLLGDEEVICNGDQFLGPNSGLWLEVSSVIGDTVSDAREMLECVGFRRRITPPAPEWTPTNELRLRTCEGMFSGRHTIAGHDEHDATAWYFPEQKWTCGEKSEWRPIPVTTEGA